MAILVPRAAIGLSGWLEGKMRAFLCIVASLILCGRAAGQTLIYSLSYAETPASRSARFPHGALGATIDQQFAMLRDYRKTEIYSVSMIDGKRSRLFSDDGMHLEIKPVGATLGSGSAYAIAVVPGHTAPGPAAGYSDPAALYEISLDGSNRTRRLFETQPSQTSPVLNRQGEKAVFAGYLNERYVVSVYSVSSWTSLYRWDLTKLMQAHCASCNLTSYGWLEDGDRLFFNLVIGDEDDVNSKAPNVPGTYTVSGDGGHFSALPATAGDLQLSGYRRWIELASGDPPSLIGQTVSGDYLFRDYAVKTGTVPKPPKGPESFLVITGPDFRSRKQIPLQLAGLDSFSLSPSGRYIAYIENRQTQDYRSEHHLWGLDLESGLKRELLATPPPALPTSPEPNLVLTVLGWLDNR